MEHATPASPVVSASVSLSSNKHSHSSNDPPLLSLTITSKHPSTITIYGDDLSPAGMLRHGALEITDLTTGLPLCQSTRTRCVFEPPTKIKVSHNEDLFHELKPGEPLVLTAPFCRTRKPPLPKNSPGFENSPGARDRYITGIDGLEPRHRYLIQLSSKSRIHWTTIRWWEYGTKDSVLRPDGGNDIALDARKVKFKKGPHSPIQLTIVGSHPLELECTE